MTNHEATIDALQAEIDELRRERDELLANQLIDNAVCCCGHSWEDHEILGPDEYGCNDETCECIQTSVGVLGVIEALRSEITHIRALVRDAFEEGWALGRHAEGCWDNSNAKKELE